MINGQRKAFKLKLSAEYLFNIINDFYKSTILGKTSTLVDIKFNFDNGSITLTFNDYKNGFEINEIAEIPYVSIEYLQEQNNESNNN